MSTSKDARKLCLLTGATGFVGRQILRELVAQNWKVRLVLRTQSAINPDDEIYRTSVIESIRRSNDLFKEDVQWWADACQDVALVIHSAWYVDPADYLQSPRNFECVSGTLALAMGAVSAHVPKFVGIGTCLEYQLSNNDLSTHTPLDPQTVYAASKAATYLALNRYFVQSNVEFLWCRLFYLFGDGEDERRLVPYIRKQLEACSVAQLSSGTQIRDFLDVREAAQQIVDAVSAGLTGAANICSGIPLTVRAIAEQIADEYGRRDLLSFEAARDRPLDPERVVGQPGGKAR